MQHYNTSNNASTESDWKETSFSCITTMQDRIAVQKHGTSWETEVKSYSTNFLQHRFCTVELLVVPEIERDIERSTFFNGCLSLGCRVQMDAANQNLST
ncbi:hypothetical protein TNCV_3213421 [Trichonephila clavipes]|nr:hypothetical protein TNCV_3213421 [Trichonephila clavipes]